MKNPANPHWGRKIFCAIVLALAIAWGVIALLPRPQNFALENNPMRKDSADSLPILIAHGGGNREFPDNTL